MLYYALRHENKKLSIFRIREMNLFIMCKLQKKEVNNGGYIMKLLQSMMAKQKKLESHVQPNSVIYKKIYIYINPSFYVGES